MSKHLLRAFATRDPERFAELLGRSDDVGSTLAILTDIPDGMECDVVSRLTPEASTRLLNGLTDTVLTGWLETAPVDAGRRLLARIGGNRSSRLIEAVEDRSKRRELKRLVGYPRGSIGELIQTQMAAVKDNTPSGDIGTEIRNQGGDNAGPVVVERRDGTFRGVLDFAALALNRDPAATAADFCVPVRPVFPDSPLASLESAPEWAGMASLPVVDHEGRALGYVSRSVLDNINIAVRAENSILASVVELSKRFWEVSAALTLFIFERRVER